MRRNRTIYNTALKHEVSASEMQYLRDQGLTNKAIAERLDISPATVCRYLHPKSPRLTDNDKQAIVEMLKNGKTVKEIAEDYEKSVATIYGVLKEAGIKRELKYKPANGEQRDEIEQAKEEFKPSGRLIFDRICVYSGRLGEYYVDKEKLVVMLPPMPHQLSKDEVGYLIRDLMTAWQEV